MPKKNKVNDFYHKISSTIVNQMIVVEDLNFNSMKDNYSSLDNELEKSKKNKTNHLPDKDKNPGKLKFNNSLLFNVNKTQA